MTYLTEIKRAMKLLADKDYYLIGQNTRYGGTSMFHTTKDFPEERRIELPITEEMQAGIGTGMSLEGMNIISIYPRFDFFILALNQVINHLDKAELMSDGQFKPKQIFRVCVGSIKPMMPGPQHCQDHTEAIKRMVTNIEVRTLLKAEDVYKAYKEAVNSDKSFIIVEYSDFYNKDFAFTEIKDSKEVK
ncbi:MAG: hypothetical protein IH948_00270 [Bacteroidetes bacterium]|nr:hypothetical protein [Bacteroidota bacterium]